MISYRCHINDPHSSGAGLADGRQFEDVSGFQFAGLFLPPLISAFIIASLIVLGNVYIQLYGAYLVIVDICFLVFMNLYILYLFSYQSRNRKLKEELKTFQRQSEMQYHYYKKLEEKYESSVHGQPYAEHHTE